MQNGNTALMSAAFEGHVECVRVLLQAGADPSMANNVRLVGEEDVVEVVS